MLANLQGEVGQSTAGWIGDNGNALGEAGKTIAHGVTSGAIAEITGGKFAAGAVGGAMSELASNWSLGAFGGNEEYQVALNNMPLTAEQALACFSASTNVERLFIQAFNSIKL